MKMVLTISSGLNKIKDTQMSLFLSFFDKYGQFMKLNTETLITKVTDYHFSFALYYF